MLAGSLFGQKKFNWQDYCFFHSTAPFCYGHDFAIKPNAPGKKAKPPNGVADSGLFPEEIETVAPSVIVVGAINWRFADPSADALVGFNVGGLSASPLGRSLIAQVGANQGLSAADMQKIFEGLSGVYRIALSVRDDQIVAMITGRLKDSTFPGLEAGWKAVPVGGNAVLVGNAEAVDQAVKRMTADGASAEVTRLGEQWPADREFWSVGSAGTEAASAGMKRFSVTMSIRDRLTSNAAFEFNGAPDENTVRTWQATLGSVTVEGNVVRIRSSIEADEVPQRFGEIAAGPLGQQLDALVKVARSLPVREAAAQTKPVIYGLDKD